MSVFTKFVGPTTCRSDVRVTSLFLGKLACLVLCSYHRVTCSEIDRSRCSTIFQQYCMTMLWRLPAAISFCACSVLDKTCAWPASLISPTCASSCPKTIKAVYQDSTCLALVNRCILSRLLSTIQGSVVQLSEHHNIGRISWVCYIGDIGN
jgi:hypothetical protein